MFHTTIEIILKTSRFQIKQFSNYVKHIAEKTICRIFTLDYEKDSSNGSKYFTRIFQI